jgi:hypothetical protein
MLYEPSYKMLDLQPLVQNYTYQMTQGQAGSEDELPRQQFDNMLKDTLQKNGFVMAVYEFSVMNQQLAEMKAKCDELIVLIQEEIQEDSR